MGNRRKFEAAKLVATPAARRAVIDAEERSAALRKQPPGRGELFLWQQLEEQVRDRRDELIDLALTDLGYVWRSSDGSWQIPWHRRWLPVGVPCSQR